MKNKTNKLNLIFSFIISLFLTFFFIYKNINENYFLDYHYKIFLLISEKIKNFDVIILPIEIFFKSFFYYPVALLSKFEINNNLLYKIFICNIFILISIISSIIFNKFFNKKQFNIFVILLSLLYTFNPLTLYLFYNFKIEELLSISYFPLIFYGIFSLLKNKENYVYITLGLSLLIYTDWNIYLLNILIILLIYTLNLKKIFSEPYIFFITLKSIIFSLLIGCFQIIPFLEIIYTENIKINNNIILINNLNIEYLIPFIILMIISINCLNKLKYKNNILLILLFFIYINYKIKDYKLFFDNNIFSISIILLFLFYLICSIKTKNNFGNIFFKILIMFIFLLNIKIILISDYTNIINNELFYKNNEINFETNINTAIEVKINEKFLNNEFLKDKLNEDNNLIINYNREKLYLISFFITTLFLLIFIIDFIKEENNINKTKFSNNAIKYFNIHDY